MRVIGTAGHVDHGKSTLIKALTGIHPDRLKEEREREMTIDLGFAWMTLDPDGILPDGEEVGIIDVPGHRDFIENMLSGIGGIDAALFVVAADEGAMPQTREHLAILDLLEINSGIVVLSKIDLIQDKEWLDLIEDDLHELFKGTILEGAPIVRVSAVSGEGLPKLEHELRTCLASKPPRRDLGKPRLPVDRVFTISGFGTVVTGTLIDGVLKVGDEVEVLGDVESEARGRIRGLQTHKKKEEFSIPGSRTAVNISGMRVEDIKRGNVITHPGDYITTRRFDARFRLLKDAHSPMVHNMEVKLFVGAAEVVARVRLLGMDELLPGDSAWLQLELEKPVVVTRGDRYILRRPSPGETLGGGVVVEPLSRKRHKRFSGEVIEKLETLLKGTPEDILYQTVVTFTSARFGEILDSSHLEWEAAQKAVRQLLDHKKIVLIEANPDESLDRQTLITSRIYWEGLMDQSLQAINRFHLTYPLRKGMPKEELKSRLRISSRIFNALLNYMMYIDVIEEKGPFVIKKGFTISFSSNEQKQIDTLLGKFRASPYSPPTVKDCLGEINEEIYNALIDLGILTFVPPDVVFRSEDYQEMVNKIKDLLLQQDTLSAAQVRDYFNTSRRYALAVLEYLDKIGITIREGDVRRLKK